MNPFARLIILFSMATALPLISVAADLQIPFKPKQDPGEIAMRDEDSSERERNTRDSRIVRRYFENRGYYNYSSPPYPVYGPPIPGTRSYYFYYSRPRDFYDSGDNGGVYFFPRQYPVQ